MDVNGWFRLLFTPLMLISSLALTLVVRVRPDGDLPTYRRRRASVSSSIALPCSPFK